MEKLETVMDRGVLSEQHTWPSKSGEKGGQCYHIIVLSTEKKMHTLQVENCVLFSEQN